MAPAVLKPVGIPSTWTLMAQRGDLAMGRSIGSGLGRHSTCREGNQGAEGEVQRDFKGSNGFVFTTAPDTDENKGGNQS